MGCEVGEDNMKRCLSRVWRSIMGWLQWVRPKTVRFRARKQNYFCTDGLWVVATTANSGRLRDVSFPAQIFSMFVSSL